MQIPKAILALFTELIDNSSTEVFDPWLMDSMEKFIVMPFMNGLAL